MRTDAEPLACIRHVWRLGSVRGSSFKGEPRRVGSVSRTSIVVHIAQSLLQIVFQGFLKYYISAMQQFLLTSILTLVTVGQVRAGLGTYIVRPFLARVSACVLIHDFLDFR